MEFDAYEAWLGISPGHRPPTHYELLGLNAYESDATKIEQAALRRIGKVRQYQIGAHSDLSQEILSQLARARLVLMDPDRRAEYDARLRNDEARASQPIRPAKPKPRPIKTATENAEPDTGGGEPEVFGTLKLDASKSEPRPIGKRPAQSRPSGLKGTLIRRSMYVIGHGAIFSCALYWTGYWKKIVPEWMRPNEPAQVATPKVATSKVATSKVASETSRLPNQQRPVVRAEVPQTIPVQPKPQPKPEPPAEDSVALNAKAWTLATSDKAALRNGARAVELATQACEQDGFQHHLFLDTLAAAHAEAGDFAEAIDRENEAIKKCQSLRDLEAYRERLALYQARKPFHEDPMRRSTVATSPSEPKPFQSLFDERDWKRDWRIDPKQPGNWRIRNGNLQGSGATASHIYSKRDDYKNFHLLVETKINPGGNSSINFRTPFGASWPANAPAWPRGYDVQISNGPLTPENKNLTGSLYVWGGPSTTAMKVGVKTAEIPPDEFFTMEVIAFGNHIIVKVDGQTTADFIDPDRSFSKGHIALQQIGPQTSVEFKRIEIRELDENGKPLDDIKSEGKSAALSAMSDKAKETTPKGAPVEKPPEPDFAAFQEMKKKAKDALIEEFGVRVATLQNSKMNAQKAALIQAISSEKASFLANEAHIPWSPAMRMATLRYFERMRRAAAVLDRSFEVAENHYAKLNDENTVKQLRADRVKALAPYPIAIWDCEVIDTGRKFSHVLLSNGHVNTPESPASWELSVDGLMILNGQRWDRWVISPDGKSLEGLTQDNVSYRGRLR